jgi:hypothetical protein
LHEIDITRGSDTGLSIARAALGGEPPEPPRPSDPADHETPSTEATSTPATSPSEPEVLPPSEEVIVRPADTPDRPEEEAAPAAYTSGTPEQKEQFTTQLGRLREEFPSAVVIGHVARAAMYATAGEPVTEPMPLSSRPWHKPEQLEPCDIDIVDPTRQANLYRSTTELGPLDRLGPHPVDTFVNRLVSHRGPTPAVGFMEHVTPVDPAVFETRTRMLDGAEVQTFTYGTQFFVDRIMRGPGEAGKYERARADFADFVSRQMRDHPDEFLPDEAYEAFRIYNPAVGHLPAPAAPDQEPRPHPA